MSETSGVERRDEIIRALRDASVPDCAAGVIGQDIATGREAVRLLLVADEPIFREGLLRLLDRYPTVHVAGWTDRVATAALMAPTHQPEALLVCVHPMTQVHDLARQLPGTPILALLPAPTMGDVAAATAAGVCGILDRTAEIDDIVEALRVVRRGLVVHPPVTNVAVPATGAAGPAPPDEEQKPPDAADEEANLVVAAHNEAVNGNGVVNGNGIVSRAANGAAPDLGLLTPRERQILQLLVDGYSVKQVASRLGIAMQTGKNHIHNIMSKVGASTRLQLCAWANDHGMHPSRPLLPGGVSEDDGF